MLRDHAAADHAWRPVGALIGNDTTLALAAYAAIGAVVGQLLGGDRAEERGVLALACGSWQPGIAPAIAHLTFPDDKNVLPAILLLYLVVGALVAARHLRWIRR